MGILVVPANESIRFVGSVRRYAGSGSAGMRPMQERVWQHRGDAAAMLLEAERRFEIVTYTAIPFAR